MTVLYVAILAGVWFVSLLVAYGLGVEKGWTKGHEDTKKATFEVLDKQK